MRRSLKRTWLLALALAMPCPSSAQPPFPGARPDYRAWTGWKLPGSAEGLTVDQNGQLYASLISKGQIIRLEPDGRFTVVATIPTPELATKGVSSGIFIGHSGVMYVAYRWNYSLADEKDERHLACHDARDIYTGVYKVDVTNGKVTPLVTRKNGWPGCFPDDLVEDSRGNVYLTDLTLSGVWKIAPDGSYKLWSSHPLVNWPAAPYFAWPEGANPIVISKDETRIFVGTDGAPGVVEIPILPDGGAGEPRLKISNLTPLDGLELDDAGNIFISELFRNEISVFAPDGTKRVVIATEDTAPLSYPTNIIYQNGVLCAANLGDEDPTRPQSGSVACIKGFRMPQDPKP